MEEIIKIYENKIGISFQWVNTTTHLTQIVFRDLGFHLSLYEIEMFLEKIEKTKLQGKCNQCCLGEDCRSLLLKTPSNKVSLAVSAVELEQIEDLLKGTLFQLRLTTYLEEICNN